MHHIIFDLEATCWEDRNLAEDKETIEIAAVRLDDRLEPGGEFDCLVRPMEQPVLSAFCSGLSRIRQERIDQADPFPAVFQKFLGWIGEGGVILAAWGDFDIGQLQRDCRRHGIKFPKRLLKKQADIKAAFASRHRIRPCSLLQAMQMLHIAPDATGHRGIADARATARIYRSLAK